MAKTVIPEGYAPSLNLYDTQKAIGLLNRLFEDTLAGALNLRRVSAPLFVEASASERWSAPFGARIPARRASRRQRPA